MYTKTKKHTKKFSKTYTYTKTKKTHKKIYKTYVYKKTHVPGVRKSSSQTSISTCAPAFDIWLCR